MIALISDAAASSRFFIDELETAISNNVPVLPIVIKSLDTFSVTLDKINQQIPKLQDINALFISENPTDTEISDVVRSAVRIKEELEYYDRQKNDLPRFF